MLKYIYILFLLSILNSKSLLIDSDHAFLSSIETFIDTENVIDESSDDYEREISLMGSFDISYVFKKSLELNLIFVKNSSNSSNFVLPPNIDAHGLKFKYTLKNVINKILNLSKRDDIVKSTKFDFNLNFNIENIINSEIDLSVIGYGFGLSMKLEDQSLVNDYTLYPSINFVHYESLQGNISKIDETIKLEILTDIATPPKDNKEVFTGFYINPSINILNLKDSYLGLQIGIYHKL